MKTSKNPVAQPRDPSQVEAARHDVRGLEQPGPSAEVGIVGFEAPDRPGLPYITVVDTGKPCGKFVDNDGKVRRVENARVWGTARTVYAPPEELAGVLREVGPNEYVTPDYVLGSTNYKLLTQKEYQRRFGNSSGALTQDRLGACYAALTPTPGVWAFGAWRVLDRDIDEHTPEPYRSMPYDDWFKSVDRHLLPGVASAPRVHMPSSKTRVGIESESSHTWVLCKGAEDTNILRKRVMPSAVARSAGLPVPLVWEKPRRRRDGSDEVIGHATATLFDHMVWTIHRHIYAGPPHVPDDLPSEIGHQRRLRPAEVTIVEPPDARPLDLRKALPSPSEQDLKRYGDVVQSTVRQDKDGRVRVDNHSLLKLDTWVEIQGHGVVTVEEFKTSDAFDFSGDESDRGKYRCQCIFRDSDSWNGIIRKFRDGRVMHHDNGSGITYWLADVQAEFEDLTAKSGSTPPPPQGDPSADPCDWTQEFIVPDEEIKKLKRPAWIIPNLVIRGHMVIVVAEPNGGKTTLFAHLAGEMVQAGYRVFYVNADISGSDAAKFIEASRAGGWTAMLPDLIPGMSMQDVIERLEKMNESGGDLTDVVFIFDTFKKMTDVINKTSVKTLLKLMRSLTGKGMTIILLGHTNKYKDSDGKPVYEGTGDVRADADELIYLIPQKHTDGSMTVSTDPNKVRGDFQPISFEIDKNLNVSRAASYVDTAAARAEAERYKIDGPDIRVILDAIEAGKHKQTEIIEHCRSHRIGKRSALRILHDYDHGRYQKWRPERAPEHNIVRYHAVTEEFDIL